MKTTNEVISITRCMLCGQPHQFNMEVMRSPVAFDISEDEPKEKRIRRTFTCPQTGNDFESVVIIREDAQGKLISVTMEGQEKKEKEAQLPGIENQIEAPQMSLGSPHSRAIYEAGKAILLDSFNTAREFCQSMIGISTGAIPVYLGILGFLMPEGTKPGYATTLMLILPAIGFLAASTLFTLGYLPVSGRFSLDILDEIEQAFEKGMAHRKRYIQSGMGVFIASTLLSIIVIILSLGQR